MDIKFEIDMTLSNLVPEEDQNKSTKPKKYPSIPVKKQNNALPKPHNKKNEDEVIWFKCGNCEKRIKKPKKNLGCKCKDLHYCSWGCRESSNHYKNCQGKVPENISKETLEKYINSDDGINKEYLTEQEKKGEELFKKYKNRKEIVRAAEEGLDPYAALQVGVSFEYRYGEEIILEKKQAKVMHMPDKYFNESQVFTDKMALKYYEIAAQAGLAVGMLALGDMMFHASIIYERRIAYYWLARAFETEPNAFGKDHLKMLNDCPIISKDYQAMSSNFDQLSSAIESSQRTSKIRLKCSQQIFAPNLAGLLMATNAENILKLNGKTCTGGIFWAFEHFKKIFNHKVQRQLSDMKFVVGRSGVPSAATAKMLKDAGSKRPVNNTRFKQGQKGSLDDGKLMDLEQVTMDHNDAWYTIKRSKYLMACCHFKNAEDANSKPINVGECSDCLDDAIKRVEAVAEGQFSISIDEHVPGYAYAAKYYSTKAGDLVLNTFKSYSQPEVCCVLQCLMSNPADLHPLHLAEDPNLFWPLIWYYGSLHHAVLQCCGEKTAKKIYGPKHCFNKISSGNVCPENINSFPRGAEGEVTITCGNDFCPEVRRESAFVTCQGCKVRKYCTRECAGKDWPIHKAECKNKQNTAAPTTDAKDSKKEKGDSSINPPMKHFSGLKKGFLL